MLIISKSGTAILFAFLAISLTACVAPEAQIGLTDLSARPAEKALLAGIRSYEEAQYADAEKSLSTSLSAGFTVPKDAALAHKYLAFIYCTSSRIEECKRAFTAARAVDPGFVLSKKEIGHPQWGPVYKQTLGN
ncbi:TssQ family T6SS-associated lipoprotein [Undibacterium sp. Ren11W]|uniref:TssQ family T6SS-associated lipoprotein n=1 Tax=Undibacterium sp. Ren11W TaxID=3413045 RepID=UPI003BF0B3B1